MDTKVVVVVDDVRGGRKYEVRTQVGKSGMVETIAGSFGTLYEATTRAHELSQLGKLGPIAAQLSRISELAILISSSNAEQPGNGGQYATKAHMRAWADAISRHAELAYESLSNNKETENS